MWNGEICKPEYVSKSLTDMGLCYTFNNNPDNILSSSETGDLIDINVKNDVY